MRRRFLLCLALFCSLTIPVAPANAAWIQYQSGPADTYNRPDLPAEYDITRTDFGVSDTYPDEYWFFLTFAKNVTANQFADGKDSWAAIFLDVNNDGKLDYSLETDSKPYDGNYYKPGLFEDRTSGHPVASTVCNVQTWTNLTANANWIGFSIKKNCLSLSSSIGLQGYADHIPNDNAEFDYAPETIWTINPNGGVITPSGNSSSTTVLGQLPAVSTAGESLVTSPAAPPPDLVSLAAETTKSVVTVLCGTGLGSGWSINASLSTSNTSTGYKSYIITNHHVIANCTSSRNVTLVLSDQSRVQGYVYAWDEVNDVAGILTATNIPTLNWRGPTPQQGWWVGIIGSPLGFPGILTSGIVSSVNTSTYLGTTNAAINPGNSGGPVFDRSGRVIGLATAKYVNAENFGIFNGTPLLCYKIVSCNSASQVWEGAVVATPTTSPTPAVNTLVIAAKSKVDDALNKVEVAISDCTDLLQSKGSEIESFILSTMYSGNCDSLYPKINDIKAAYAGIDTSKMEASTAISKLEGYISSLNSIHKSVVEISDDLRSSLEIFADVSTRITSAQNAIDNNRELFNQFTKTIKMLPTTLQSKIKKTPQYLQIINGLNLERKFDAALSSQNAMSKDISDKITLNRFNDSLRVFENRYKDFLTISSKIEDLKLLVPDFICLKGKLSTLTLKSGICPKGYTKKATFEA
jgi:hypothetical protein